ncbi:hypothetical protein N8Z73_01305 [bacterium]|nr:hypothetical protein [bacterium]
MHYFEIGYSVFDISKRALVSGSEDPQIELCENLLREVERSATAREN